MVLQFLQIDYVLLLYTDKSQLLLCGEPVKRGVRIDQAELQEILKDNKSPRCLPNKDILLYTGTILVPGSSNLFIYCSIHRHSGMKMFL